MAALTGLGVFDAERHAETMAGPAELTLIHLFHDPALFGSPGLDNRIMTVGTGISLLGMDLVIELNMAGDCREFVAHRAGIAGMAFLAVALDTKRGGIIVARSAGFATLHLGHTDRLVGSLGRQVQRRMAVFAAERPKMRRMAENRTAGVVPDLLDRVAFCAGILDSEGGFAVVAGAAGVPFFHVSHGKALAPLARDENAVVTVGAAGNLGVGGMAEGCRAGFLDGKGYRDG